ncbi:MAG: phosphatidylserine decarboxylase family protein [Thermodesulfobacteriota bacterium]
MRIPVAREGYPFILLSVAVIIIFSIFYNTILFALSLCLTLFIISFFRDPERELPDVPNSFVAPADGKVIKVDTVREERFLGEDALRICIFMNLFNVHVNRAPASGRVAGVAYNHGRFFSANLDKASLENEQNALLIETEEGRRFVVVQIAGLVARRIVCYVREGDAVERGKRFGMIRFGSRLDVYLPTDSVITVKVGDRVKAGASLLGVWGT